ADHTEELRQATKGKRPAWVVIQAHGGYVYRTDFRGVPGAQLPPSEIRSRSRGPTPRELRCMTYLALIHGANGLIYYYYRDIKMMYDSEARWAILKTIGQEVKDLSPVLIASDIHQDRIV